jgi:hypothetical protein
MIAVGVYVYLYVPKGAAEAVGPRRLGARPGKKKWVQPPGVSVQAHSDESYMFQEIHHTAPSIFLEEKTYAHNDTK